MLRKFALRLRLRTVLFLFVKRLQIVAIWRRFLKGVKASVATNIGLLIASAFAVYLPDEYSNGLALTTSGVHLACAGIIGTALALVLTLSIVPAQKAADVFSSAILLLYARDRHLFVVVATLSFLCLISLLFGTNWTFGFSARNMIAVQFVALGTALDMLRAFYARALDLLIPVTALGLVEKECSRWIKAMHRESERIALVLRLIGGDSGDGSGANLRWLYYRSTQAPGHLKAWISHLEEFAHKAVVRRDTQAAKAITILMASIGKKYADSRRSSLVLLPDFSVPFAPPISDVGDVLNTIYEGLRNICEDAVRQPNEAIVIGCLQALGDMAVHAMSIIHTQNGFRNSAPLARPIHQSLDGRGLMCCGRA